MISTKQKSISDQVDDWTQAEILDLITHLVDKARLKASAKPPTDLGKYAGTVKLSMDPLEFQRQIRDEWN